MKRGPYRGSFLWKLQHLPIEEVRDVVKDSLSIREICNHLGLQINGSTFPAFKSFARENNIDFSHLLGKQKPSPRKGKVTPIDVNKIFKVHLKKRGTGGVRKALLQIGVNHCCELCKLGPEWNGKHLVLQIDHINGDPRDDRRENVRFLCPNCHSQTDTFTGKNVKRRKG